LRHRFHLDALPLPGHDQQDEIARLERLGARRVDVGQGAVSWQPMADVAGNDFCVLANGAGEK
ncbi:VOC family protein, partial [Streptomyces sp. SID11233]|nr:VOC family protein [Streptomyces sp. SID11233]